MKGPSNRFLLSGFVACTLLSASLAADDKASAFAYDYAEEAAIAQGIDVDNPDPEQLRPYFRSGVRESCRRFRMAPCLFFPSIAPRSGVSSSRFRIPTITISST